MLILLAVIGLFLCSARVSLAAPSIDFTFNSFVSSNTFPVTFTISNADVGTTYYLKISGNIASNTTNNDIKTISLSGTELSFTSSWSSFPTVVIDAGGSAVSTLQAKAVNPGTGIMTLKIANTTNTASSYSQDKTYTAIAPTPTATLTPTNTLTPTATHTPVPTMPQPKISIVTFPSVAHIQQAFSLRFEITNLTANTDYRIKGIGGVNGLESIETFNGTGWYDYSSSWDNLPKFKTDGNGKISSSISMRVKSDQSVGEYKIQIRLRASDNNFDSDLKYVTIQAKLPSVTPTPNDPSPSVTPTFEPSPTPEPEVPTLVPTESELPSDIVITPTPASAVRTSSSKVSLPLLFMLAGGILIIAPFGITYLSRVKKNS